MRTRMVLGSAVAGAAILVAALAWAQEPQRGAAGQAGQMGQTGAQADRLGTTGWHKSKDLVGKNINDAQNNKLGDVKDLVIDMNTGQVLFCVISGRVVDKKDQDIAIPFQAFRLDADARNLVLNTSKDKLRDAPAFNENSWPNMTDQSFVQKVYAHFNVPAPMEHGAIRQAGDIERERGGTNTLGATGWQKSKDLVGKNINDAQNNKLGDVKDLVIDMNTGRVLFCVISGRVVDKSKEDIAIPFLACRLEPDGKNLVLNTSKDKLRDAPAFDENNWPNMTDQTFVQRVYAHFGVPAPTERGAIREAGDIERERGGTNPPGGTDRPGGTEQPERR